MSFTLRDLRRWAARPGCVVRNSANWRRDDDWVSLSRRDDGPNASARAAGSFPRGLLPHGDVPPAAIDRLISRYGARQSIILLGDRIDREWEAARAASRATAERQDHHADPEDTSDGAHADPEADGHGGDGNSGDCDHRADTAADTPREGGGEEDSPAAAPGQGAGNDAGQSRTESGTPGSTGDGSGETTGGSRSQDVDGSVSDGASAEDLGPDRDRPSLGDGGTRGVAPAPTAGLSASDTPGESPAAAGGVVVSGLVGSTPAATARDGEAASPAQTEGDGLPSTPERQEAPVIDLREILRTLESGVVSEGEVGHGVTHGAPSRGAPRHAHGGVHAQIGAAQGADPRETRRALRALERLLRSVDVGVGTEPSPRVSGRRLVREIAGRSYRPSRWRREELEHGRVLVLPDVSGSCSVAAPSTVAAACALADQDPRVWVISHSNGVPIESYGQGAPPIPADLGVGWDYGQATWWLELLARERIEAVIALGDTDAVTVYRALAEQLTEGGLLVWLDSYRCRVYGYTPRLEDPPWWPSPPASKGRIWYAAGVGDVAGLAGALRMIGRARG